MDRKPCSWCICDIFVHQVLSGFSLGLHRTLSMNPWVIYNVLLAVLTKKTNSPAEKEG